jgi:hypothetical protein
VRAERKVNLPVVLTGDLFPAREMSTDPLSGKVRRHHIDPSVINRAIKLAGRRSGLSKVINVATTMIYTHVVQLRGQGVPSPPDVLKVEGIVERPRGDVQN